MKFSNLLFTDNNTLTENEYDLANEAVFASLFTTGNGYIGVRGSLEELGSDGIQGAYIRGLIDRIVEIPAPICDNLYMKKYYIDEEKLKYFETQDSIINFADFLLVRIYIDGEVFYPWEGRLISWKRSLSLDTGVLTREAVWENSKGHITKFEFQRFSSFADDHLYCMRVRITPQNHDAKITVVSGIDTRTRTNGQRISKKLSSDVTDDGLFCRTLCGEEFGFEIFTGVVNKMDNDAKLTESENGDIISATFEYEGKEGVAATLEKFIYTVTSRDDDGFIETTKAMVKRLKDETYDGLIARHLSVYGDIFGALDIKIEGDDNLDASVRFSNYHTAISVARNDCVHSLSAKGLTGEKYNNFVWWDCEVYQMPVFLHTVPEAAKNCILYRYNLLNAARENAKKEGCRGARFPFTSSVTGEETVWIYARHPFMQIHIVSDVGLSCVQYYHCTGDKKFFLKYGFEILLETARYFADRVEWVKENERYEIKTVTGTDEHHPYVDNNAYTNYCVWMLFNYAVRYFNEFNAECTSLFDKIGMSAEEAANWKDIAEKLYLPFDDATGMIPQFDGYFDLNRSLEISGGSAATSFQMKQSGLYHLSQVIKQPDVMLLFSNYNLPFAEKVYKKNWNYYENRCEASSSLSYCVHSICASDLDQPDSAYKYLLKTARLDMDDEHNCAKDGIHSACAAGAWIAVVRGVAGIVLREKEIEVHPHMIPWLKKISFGFVWHGQKIFAELDNEGITLTSSADNTQSVGIYFKGQKAEIAVGGAFTIKADTFNNADLI